MKKSPLTQPSTQNSTTSVDTKDLEINSLKDRLARALADYQNLEARHNRDSATLIQFANANLLAKILEVRDHLALAASSGDKSLSLILSTLDKILAEEGVKTIPTDGDFDPHLMECVEEVDGPKNKIIKTMRTGYLLHERLLRTARVAVGNGQNHDATPASATQQLPSDDTLPIDSPTTTKKGASPTKVN